MTGQPVGLADARSYLKPLLRKASERITVNKVIDLAASYFDVRREDLLGKSRQRQITLARQVAMTLCRVHLEKACPKLAGPLGA